MKIKQGFILREIAGSYIVVAVGDAVKTFNGVINLNQTGALLWKELSKGGDEETLLKALLAEYDVSEEIAKKDIELFIAKLKGANLLV